MKRDSNRLRLLVFAALLTSAAILFVACASATPTVLVGATTAPSPTVFTAPIAVPSPAHSTSTPPPVAVSPTPLVSTSPTLPIAVSPASSPRLVVLAPNLAEPDDLVLAPDGSIYFSDVGSGTVGRLGAGGEITTILSNLKEPEGMAFLPNGSLIIAEQVTNRLLHYDLNTRQLTTFLQLENRTGNPGVDGISFDARTGTIIVPDSPNGTLLRVSADGRRVQTLARGLARPTGAAIASDGSILVADENGAAVVRVPANGGSARVIARMPVPDDVILDAGGNIYVNTLGEGAIHRIDAHTGQNQIFWRGLSSPQGILFDADGNLIIADAGNHRIVKIVMR
jgi:sugar lactone lactonase YvrE